MMAKNDVELGVRIGIDVGGTFTDFVLFNPANKLFTFHKQPSVPVDPAMAVSEGLKQLVKKSQLQASDISLLLHGTTLGLNAIIQRRGAKIGLVASIIWANSLRTSKAYRRPSSLRWI